MSKIFAPSRLQAIFTVVLLLSISTYVYGDDRFAVAVGAHDSLIVFGPKGERLAELPVPSISQPVTVGATSFQVSYGRDANDRLTAIFAPNSSQPQDLHFTVLNKSIDTDKQAVVTLTFSQSLKSVSVDPGYVGLVHVDSHSVKHRELADDTYTPSAAPRLRTTTTTDLSPRDVPDSSAIVHEPVSTPAPKPMVTETATTTTSETSYTEGSSDLGTYSKAEPSGEPLFWSEPVTPPRGYGAPPQVAADQMKLLEVQGTVTVNTPNGSSKVGHNGMIIPTGSTVETVGNSSAAVLMGGVNSARLLPDTEAQINQHMNGSVRKTTIDLHQGTVFSRVGRRAGETQNYQVSTPEGVAAARGTEFADNRTQGHHYIFVRKGAVAIEVHGNLFRVLTGDSQSVQIGVVPPAADGESVFHEVMEIVQSFNLKLQGVLDRINGGTASADDIAFYDATLVGDTTGFDAAHHMASATGYGDSPHSTVPTPQDYRYPNPVTDLLPPERRATNQDLQPFGTNPVTPY